MTGKYIDYTEEFAAAFIDKYRESPQDLALRVYTSRLIGSNSSMVLPGGGNTSVKTKLQNVFGDEIDVLFVKGSGCDLASIEPEGFTGLKLDQLLKLRKLDTLSDREMENQLLINRLESRSPDPSVEALLHAFLPHKFIDHTHADAVLVLTNQRNGRELIAEALGTAVAIVPYAMSGLPLAKAVAKKYEERPEIDAVVILNHGIFTFAKEARASYEKMLDYVQRAEEFIKSKIGGKPLMTPRAGLAPPSDSRSAMVRVASVIRGACSHSAGEKLRRFHVEFRDSPDLVDTSLSKEALEICNSGVLTPDHAIRTKNKVAYIDSVSVEDDGLKRLVVEVVDDYRNEYHKYFSRCADSQGRDIHELDPYPRLFLVAGIGLVAVGPTRKDALIAADIGEHTVRAKLIAGAIGKYEGIPENHVFDMEYWTLQQKKIDVSEPLLQGQIAVVTGAGGAIGFGVADCLLEAGAAVAVSDIDPSRLEKVYSLLADKYDENLIEPTVFDVADPDSVKRGFEEICIKFGGVDIVVPNAGVAHVAKIEDLDAEKFARVIEVNLLGTFNVIRASIPIFRRQGTGGNIVVVSSKNVFDPGAAFGAYSASKAGAHQISKIAALELAELGVRVNMVNPDAIFGDEEVSSQLWDLVGPDRMKARGLDAAGLREYYRQRNLLKERVLAKHVGNAVVFFSGNQTPTTGASLPIDGGIPAAFPR